IDFGSQTTHLIARRLKEVGSKIEIFEPDGVMSKIKKNPPQGIILSGGPSSVYEKGAPTLDKKIFNLNIPILGICYGMQLTAKLLGGEVVSGKKEYGPATLELSTINDQLLTKLPEQFTVWMSHGDEVLSMPESFEILGSTKHVPYAFVRNKKKKIYGVQFHPEVEHTQNGLMIFKNFLKICNVTLVKSKINTDEIIEKIKDQVGDSYVIGAVSGGVDSTVAGALTARAIGKRFLPIYVDTGLMREGTADQVKRIFTNFHTQPIVINAVGETLQKIRGIVNPEKKRKVIGMLFIEIFEREMKKFIKSGKNVKFLLQGTIYSDVIESKGTKNASKIKSHHNVGGLPKNMKLQLLEPLREFYKDEVRTIGGQLGLPDEFIHKQTFPGPGYAVRIRGAVTKERLAKAKKADGIILEELAHANLLQHVFMSFPVMTGAQSTAVKGDGRFFGEVMALRIVESKDIMTSTWARLPYDVLQKISSRIVNEVEGISRVVYDISTKPPATMEWE
ncbi:MAG: glutamine-hydrolyzing GMP synthase, partial [Patescibacteria group bacterium]